MDDKEKSLEQFVNSYWTLELLPKEGKSPYIDGYLSGVIHTLIALDATDCLKAFPEKAIRKSDFSAVQSKEASRPQ